MFDLIFDDLTGSVEAVATGSQLATLVIIGIVAVAQGLTMGSWMSIWGRAAQGLLVLGLALFLWDVLSSEQRFDLDLWDAEGRQSWTELMLLTVKTLFGYYFVMWIAILIVYMVRALFNR